MDLKWQGSVALRDAAKDVAKLKQEDGSVLVTQGSTELVHVLLAAGLVDEIRTFTFPCCSAKANGCSAGTASRARSNSRTAPSRQTGSSPRLTFAMAR